MHNTLKKRTHLSQSIFEIGLFIMLLLPFISLFTYLLFDFFFNFNTVYFIVNILLIFLSFSFMRKIKGEQIGIFSKFFLILLFNFIGFVLQGPSGVFEFFRAISGYYMFFFWGWCCYKIYFERGKLIRLYRIIVYSATWISLINLTLFVWLQTDDYRIDGWQIEFQSFQPVANYVNLLNKNYIDYIIISANYNDVGFMRGIGYFFDTHSQYFLPLCALIILFFNKHVVKASKVYAIILGASVLCSGIKTAYLTIVLLLLYYTYSSGYVLKYFKKMLPYVLILCVAFKTYIKTIFLGEGMWKIFIQLCQHFLLIPVLYIATYPINFLLGGAPFLRDNPLYYSEVFWVTVTFYIGIIGLYVYMIPSRLLKKAYSEKFYLIPKYIYIVFVLSLTHYSVYMVGINNIASALPIMFCFGRLNTSRQGNYNALSL